MLLHTGASQHSERVSDSCSQLFGSVSLICGNLKKIVAAKRARNCGALACPWKNLVEKFGTELPAPLGLLHLYTFPNCAGFAIRPWRNGEAPANSLGQTVRGIHLVTCNAPFKDEKPTAYNLLRFCPLGRVEKIL